MYGYDLMIPLLSKMKSLDNVLTICSGGSSPTCHDQHGEQLRKKGIKESNKNFQTWDWYLPHSRMFHLHNEAIVQHLEIMRKKKTRKIVRKKNLQNKSIASLKGCEKPYSVQWRKVLQNIELLETLVWK